VKARGKDTTRKTTKTVGEWVDNIKMDLGEIGWGGVDWIGLAQDRDKWRAVVNGLMNFRFPYNVGNLSSGYTTPGLLSSAQLHREREREREREKMLISF
jgi:hypothetical protein